MINLKKIQSAEYLQLNLTLASIKKINMKVFALIIISLVLVQSIKAQTETCTVLLDKISGIYSGKCKDGLANGKGKSIGEDTYIGTFKEGLPHGKGKYIYNNGNVFQGYWKNGQKDGQGKFKYKLNGETHSLIGYWKKDDYVGVSNPDLSYRVTSSSGIMEYKVEKKESLNKHDNEITFSIKSAFSDFVPRDLKVETSSGQTVQSGKKFGIRQYFCPLYCDISYSIVVGDIRKQCRFIIDIYEEGKYTITLSND